MSLIELDRPILLTREDIGENPKMFGFTVEATAAALERKAADPSTRDGVFEAAELMLRESAVAIQWVDITKPGKPIREGEELYRKEDFQLGFNDHFGGSESNFKILLNRFVEGEETAMHVLYSPPNEDGSPSNIVFHRADFTFITSPPSEKILTYSPWVPNPLKTAGVSQYLGRGMDYDFFLYGDPETPFRFSQAFEQAGFVFDPNPYNDDLAQYEETGEFTPGGKWDLSAKEHAASERLGHRGMHYWPGEQFAAQIALLREAETATN